MTYPTTTSNRAGLTYNYSYDSMYRLSGMTDASNNALVNNVSYDPSNQLLSMNYRTSSYNSFTDETRGYNTQFQLTSLTSGSLSATYNYPTGTNNGKISSSVINGETVTYQYDSLNRMIQAASSAGWGEAYGFDGFGNLTSKTGSGGTPLSVVVSPADNQIQGVYGLSYDANGNQVYGGVTYDPENRIAAAPGLQYAYDRAEQAHLELDRRHRPLGLGQRQRLFDFRVLAGRPAAGDLSDYRLQQRNN
jgi:YD repeat-containing protein